MTLLRAEHISKAFAGVAVLQDVSLQIEAHHKVGLIGANGSGKSTLLQILSGGLPPDHGTVERARRLDIGYLTQEMTLEGNRTLYEEVREAFRALLDMQTEMAALEAHLGQPNSSDSDLQRYGALLETFQAREGYAIQARVEATLFGLGFGVEDLQKPAARLSGGQKNMAALARVLLQAPDLLLLDEPSNHLDIVATEWLEGFIRDYQGAVVVISHDRYFLDRTVEQILEVERHRLVSYPGNYSAYVRAKAERLEQQRKAYEQQQAEIRRQEDFIRRNMAGQKTKQAQSRQKVLDRLERVAQPMADTRRMGLQFETNQRESHEVIICRKVHKSYGSHHVLRGIDFTVYRSEKVGLMGPNGAGKSTLLRLLMQQETADEGTLRLGRNTTVAYYDQEMEELNPDATVLDEVWQIDPLKPVGDIRSYLGRFLFSGDEVYNTIGHLSGGEKSRVALAKLMLSPANLLILDEPTNHLDIPAREALEYALAEYPGAVLIVSHDRYFLDRIVSRLLYLRDGTCEAYPGNYSDYQAHLAAKQAEAQRTPSAREAKVSNAVKTKPDEANVKKPRPPRRRKPEVIEREIGEVEAEIDTLQGIVETEQQDADWQRLAELTSQQGALATRLETLMDEWEASMMAAEEGRRS
jgi:ATP-binding cassette subfamily F protein 3